MEKYKAAVFTDNEITLENPEELDKLYQTIESDENFILEWNLNGVTYSEVVIATNISAKVKNGDLKLTAIKKLNKEK